MRFLSWRTKIDEQSYSGARDESCANFMNRSCFETAEPLQARTSTSAHFVHLITGTRSELAQAGTPRHSLREVFPQAPMWTQFIDRFGFAAGGCRLGHRLTAFHRLGIGMASRSDTQTRRRQNPRIRLSGHYHFALHLTAAMRVLNTFGYGELLYGGGVSE